MALTLERIAPTGAAWERMDAFGDRVVFQTREWLEFLARTQGAEPVVAAVMDGDERVGYFTGLVVRRFGLRILGSPFPGWTTESMGFNLDDGVSRREAAAALIPFAFRTLGCAHVELKDRRLERDDDLHGLGFTSEPTRTFEVDLSDDETAIFGRMSSACRRAVRRGEKVGVTVEQATGAAFADEYYAQLVEVFARQSLVPTYDVERVRALIDCLEPTGHLLLVRARSPEGVPVATAIFPAFNRTAYFWGGASVREHQILRPNEAIFWYAMRYWRERGITTLDLGGGGEYKRKYGPRELRLPFFRRSRFPGLAVLREVARRAVEQRHALLGRARRAHVRPPTRTL
ncbi:MAG TPA: GNAT family N-acetyltransferase [Solirubrobacteraceae bacterium]